MFSLSNSSVILDVANMTSLMFNIFMLIVLVFLIFNPDMIILKTKPKKGKVHARYTLTTNIALTVAVDSVGNSSVRKITIGCPKSR